MQKPEENKYYWRRKCLYLLNSLRSSNGIFKKHVTYDKIELHEKTRLHFFSQKHTFRKTTGWVNLTPSAFFGLENENMVVSSIYACINLRLCCLLEMLSNGYIVLCMFIVIKKEYWKWKHVCSKSRKNQQIHFTNMYELWTLVLLHFETELIVSTYSRTDGNSIVVSRVFGCEV